MSRSRIGTLVALLATASSAHAACNLIPSATQTFRSTLGSLNKPYAAPGDFVEVGVRPLGCDVASTGLLGAAAQHDVTIVFTPPSGGQRRVVFLTASCALASSKKTACEMTPGVGVANVECVDGAAALALVDRNGVDKLSFRFPDTDLLFGPDGDDRTLTGPATIAVTNAANPLPCNLANMPCSAASGLIACVDDLYANDGSCAPNPHPTFTHFTALPVPNDYAADCFADVGPCTALGPDARLGVDAAGNLLLPVNWQGILASQANVPVPRLLRATIKSLAPIANPPVVSLASFTPEGARLPPIFEPQADPSVTAQDVITLFGSADAAYTILRVARGLGSCATGPNAGQPCIDSRDCGGATCQAVCVEGTAPPNTPCASDATCGPGGRCAALFTDVRPLTSGGGPLALVRATPAICQLEPHDPCASDGECLGVDNACVRYAFEARSTVPLESLTQTSDDVFAFTVTEPVGLRDKNGDSDIIDDVITLRDRTTGASQPLGAPAGCGIAGTPEGRAVVRASQAPFGFSAVATENDVLAFLESETGTTTAINPFVPDVGCDENSDGDDRDAILRVFRLGTGEITGGARAVDAGLHVNGRSLALSNGRLFFRTPEPATAPQTTIRASVAYDGSEANNYSVTDFGSAVSATGRYVVFKSLATNLLPIAIVGQHVFVRDRDLDGDGIFDELGAGNTTTEQADVTDAGVSGNGAAEYQTISADGSAVAFTTSSSNLLPGIAPTCPSYGAAFPCPQVVVRDRVNGMTTTASVDDLGNYGDGESQRASLSADGRFVVFQSGASNLVPGDTNTCAFSGTQSCFDIFVHDRCVSHGAAVAGCTPKTIRASLKQDGSQTNDSNFFGTISDDGRYVAFSASDSLVPEDSFPGPDVYVRDLLAGTTELVSADALTGMAAGGYIPRISGDGRAVGFNSSDSCGPIWPLAGGCVRDRVTGGFDYLNISATGDFGGSPTFAIPSLSSDGRFVGFGTGSYNLVPGDTNTCGDSTPGSCPDGFVRDRLTGTVERVTLTAAGGEAVHVTPSSAINVGLSASGNAFVFDSVSDQLLGAGNDNNSATDVFVRGLTPAAAAANDRSGDLGADDTILEWLDTSSGVVTPLCPAGDVVVRDGRAAFLRPETSGATTAGALPDCPIETPVTGGVRLNGDGDITDLVVHLWTGPGPGNLLNLGLEATAVALSSTHVAAIGGANGTVQRHAISGSGWMDSLERADSIQFCGDSIAFLKPVAGHHVLGYWNSSASMPTVTSHVAEDIVCNDQIVAFRTSEALQGTNLNGAPENLPDVDTSDDVLQVLELANGMTYNSNHAVTPCRLEACDPRLPYRVMGDTVRFLSFEPDQSFDLNEDGGIDDLVILSFDIATDAVRVVGTPGSGGHDPLQGGDPTPGGGGGGAVYESAGLCIETVGGSCSPCPAGTFCDAGTCKKDHGPCRIDDDCPAGLTCDLTRGSVPASPDGDGDGIPDHLDNCPDAANASQDDTDADGVGDKCDLATCGNGMIDYDEVCDGAQLGSCTGSCLGNCRCGCNTLITDPRVRVLVKTRNEIGKLVVKAEVPLATFDDATPVTIRLDDLDSSPIVMGQLANVPARGSSGTKFLYNVRTDGLQKVLLRRKPTGAWVLVVRAKRWFTAAEANRADTETYFTINIGTQCFTHAATRKVD